jgi:hypothetical protein
MAHTDLALPPLGHWIFLDLPEFERREASDHIA